jgi:ABC transport system ATP-binding/permease protein
LRLGAGAGYSRADVNLITLDGISVTLGEAPLFADATLGIDSPDRIGFVGRNGRGKSTFLRILQGSLEPDSGTVGRRRGLTVSFLEQRPAFEPGQSLAEFLRARSEVREDSEAGAEAERAALSLCTELGLADRGALMEEMSGGMVKKAALARALAPSADLLLLDEPTNHLDIETIEWLERRLRQYPGAFVLVTHDRWFLDAVCSSIMEIDRAAVYKYPGGYSEYLKRRIAREASLEKAESRRLTILERELAWLGRGARARATKSERRKDEIRAMQGAALVREEGMDGFSTSAPRLGKKILALRGASKSYDGRQVLRPLDREFKSGERLGVVGPNGSGKTTLLDLVAGRIAPDSGSVERGENTRFAYFDQTAASIDKGLPLVEYIREKAERIRMADGSELTPEQLLERFLFPRAMQGLALSRLSGGELRRAQLVRLLADSPNFLLLDEPTNDLDIDTIEQLEDFLEDFPGCVVAVSHDRAFLDRLADSILALDGTGAAREHVGGYSGYRALEAEGNGAENRPPARPQARAPARPASRAGEGADAPGGEGRRRARLGLTFAQRRELDALLEEISGLEEEKARLEAVFSGSEAGRDAGSSGRRYAEVLAGIERKTLRWEELAAIESEGSGG